MDGTQARRNQRLFEADGFTFLLISHCLKTVFSRDPKDIAMKFWVIVFRLVDDGCLAHSNLTIQCRADRELTNTFYGDGQGIECGPNLQLVVSDTHGVESPTPYEERHAEERMKEALQALLDFGVMYGEQSMVTVPAYTFYTDVQQVVKESIKAGAKWLGFSLSMTL